MLTSTFGVIMIVLGGLIALIALESAFLYAALRPTWKTGRGASREGLFEEAEPGALASADQQVGSDGRVPAGAVRG